MSFSSADNDAVSRNALTGGTGTQLYQAMMDAETELDNEIER